MNDLTTLWLFWLVIKEPVSEAINMNAARGFTQDPDDVVRGILAYMY